MNCENVELELLEPTHSEAADRHLLTCESCQAFARDLEVVTTNATLPAVSSAETKALDGLAASTWSAWQVQHQRRHSWSGYVAAAAAGALIAAAGFWTVRPTRDIGPVSEGPNEIAQAELTDEPNLSADEVFFDVTWPELADGEDL